MENELRRLREENPDATIFLTDDFIEYVHAGLFNGFDGCGCFGTSLGETDVFIKCDEQFLRSMKDEYPYVFWYNK